MSDPTGSGARDRDAKKIMRRARLTGAQQQVDEANASLSTAREVFGPKHPTVKKLVADSVDAVENRHKAIKKYQEGG